MKLSIFACPSSAVSMQSICHVFARMKQTAPEMSHLHGMINSCHISVANHHMPHKRLWCKYKFGCMPCATGVILWEVCSQEALDYGGSRPLHSPQDCPEDIADLQKACCSHSAASRPSMKEVCRILSSSSGGKRALQASVSQQANTSEPLASHDKTPAQVPGKLSTIALATS